MYRRILLVAALTIVFVAAGVGWVHCYLSPPAEQAAGAPTQADSADEDLPSACIAELAAMDGATSASRDPAISARAIAAATKPSDEDNYRPYSGGGENTLREIPEERSSHATRENHSAGISNEAAIAPNRLANDGDVARPISVAQSAEYNAPTGQAAARRPAARPPRTTTLPVSVEDSLPMKSLDTHKAADVLDLMRKLRSDLESERTPARQELLRRGFSEVDLELARQLFSPDTEVRKQLALSLPRLASVDAARWLMWLAADPQPDVRLAAITTLATTGDPSLLDRVEVLARKDSDERVQAMADQIAKQRDLAADRGGKLR